MATTLKRWGGFASLAAGVLWFGVWWHQQQAHGTTQDNEMNLIGGLTWMDSGKMLVPVFVLVFVGLAALVQWHEGPWSGIGRVGRAVTFGGLGLVLVWTALEFWPFPWGSYAVHFEDSTGLAGSDRAGAFQALASLLFAVGVTLLSIDLVRAKVIGIWLAPILIIGALATVFLSPVFWMPGAAWLVLGAVLLAKWLRAGPGQGSR